MMDEETQKRPRGRPRLHKTDMQVGTVKALERGLVLLQILSKEGSASLADLVLRTRLPTSTTHRLLTTLQLFGFVEFQEDIQKWSIGIEAFRTGSAYLVRTNLAESARKAMRHLMEETGETANLGICDDGDVVFISQVETHNPIRAFFRPGTRGYMHASGIGKALLANMSVQDLNKIIASKGLAEFTPKSLTSPEALIADLEKIRARGWSVDDEERFTGMRCVAAPIFNSYGEVVAGISVSGPTVRFSDETVQAFAAKVRQAADGVTIMIGGKIPEPS